MQEPCLPAGAAAQERPRRRQDQPGKKRGVSCLDLRGIETAQRRAQRAAARRIHLRARRAPRRPYRPPFSEEFPRGPLLLRAVSGIRAKASRPLRKASLPRQAKGPCSPVASPLLPGERATSRSRLFAAVQPLCLTLSSFRLCLYAGADAVSANAREHSS